MRILPFMTLVILLTATAPGQTPPVLDQSWTVTVNGRSATVNADGTFLVPNVAAPDLFGPGGPGTAPDFLSDDFLRLTAVRCINGVTEYAFSDWFQITTGSRYRFGQLTLTNTPPPSVNTLRVSAAREVLNQIGQTTQLATSARLNSGVNQDVTPRTSWTTYRTSNPAIATVGPDGVVTAHSSGMVTITALNDGTSATKCITVAIGDPLTDIQGFVELPNGTPVANALVNLSGTAIQALTDAEGRFILAGAPTRRGAFDLGVRANVSGVGFTGSARGIDPLPGLITDAGRIILRQGDSRFVVANSRGSGTSSGGELAIFDAATFVKEGWVTLPGNPGPMDVFDDATAAIVGSPQSQELYCVDLVPAMPAVFGTITLGFAPSEVHYLNRNVAIVGGATTIALVDLQALTVTSSLSLPASLRDFVVTPSASDVYAVTSDAVMHRAIIVGGNTLALLSAATPTPSGGSSPLNAYLAPDGSAILVTHDGSNDIGIVALDAMGAYTSTSSLDIQTTSQSAVWTPDGSRLVIYSPRSGQLVAVDRSMSGYALAGVVASGLSTSGVRYGGIDQIAITSDRQTLVVHEPHRAMLFGLPNLDYQGPIGLYANPGAGSVGSLGR